jgi:hypothetical protein
MIVRASSIFNLTPLAIVSATMRHDFDFCLILLDILVKLECMVESFFLLQHGKAKEFFSSMEHQTLSENLK